ncbi:nucleoside-diphosphate-sugar epimerase [Variovorax sp. 54]|uniref:NAD-dependent epimerase/dehydratase family protein n=1 Tax=Variovorax sp. 54 TaxID=2035212 RepID=UPI000C17570A|nr:NAD-dependent epimerase/dehydratase family protein [Variovorax sp. 54]PIF73701.1 nucleoside-diphosphate-sugar epimerase [Variovorax sp. 54]
MQILVVGGSGMIGGHAALHLAASGHEVTIASRNPPAGATPMSALAFLQGDYVAGSFRTADLARFDALVFAAGQDPRHLRKGDDAAVHWERANVEAVPRFFAQARDAGVRRAVNIGSFYPQAAPQLMAGNPYILSRHRVDEAVRALSTPDFGVVCLNPPYMLGAVPGLGSRAFERLTHYAQGRVPKIPVFAPTGGVNFMSTRSLAQAIEGALMRGEAGRAYLVGDRNLSFLDYFTAFFRAVGNTAAIPQLAQDHPLASSYAGLGGTLYFEPDPAQTALLGYARDDITRAIEEIVAQYRHP